MCGEFVAGYIANSLAIVTDAAHLLTDLASFCTSLLAMWFATKPATFRHTYGLVRAEILGTLISILTIWLLTIWLMYESVQRTRSLLRDAEAIAIDGRMMVIVSSAGLVVNIILLSVLRGHGHSHAHGTRSDDLDLINIDSSTEGPARNNDINDNNLNLRAAYIHALGDFIQNVGVLLAGCIIWWKSNINGSHIWKLADPACTFLFSLIVLYTTIQIMRVSITVLMEGVPKSVSFTKVLVLLQSIPGVESIHDLHIWSLGSNSIALTAHICLKPEPGMDPDQTFGESILIEAQSRLNAIAISHTCIQVLILPPTVFAVENPFLPQIERADSELECMCRYQERSVLEISFGRQSRTSDVVLSEVDL
eukprot:c13953_g1_i2.p1 GENE.c13953_g1_i2~~c13953_g1_i2.p1  ORF type:complete len:365 (+),score=46.11 c13953_g1_i2:130-1224(+)